MNIHLILTTEEVELLRSALDSYAYWEVADDNHRNNGYPTDAPDDPEMQQQFDEIEALDTKLMNADAPELSILPIPRKMVLKLYHRPHSVNCECARCEEVNEEIWDFLFPEAPKED